MKTFVTLSQVQMSEKGPVLLQQINPRQMKDLVRVAGQIGRMFESKAMNCLLLNTRTCHAYLRSKLIVFWLASIAMPTDRILTLTIILIAHGLNI